MLGIADPATASRVQLARLPQIQGSGFRGRALGRGLQPRTRSSALAMRATPSGRPLRRDAGEGKAQAVPAALDHEVGAGDEGDALPLASRQQRDRVGALGEVSQRK